MLLLPALAACGSRREGVPAMSGSAIPAGQAQIARLASMASHDPIAGEPDVVLRWNRIPRDSPTLRIVVHFHGFAGPADQLGLATGRLPGSGLVPPPTPPTIGLLIRGRPSPRRAGAFDWPVAATPGGLGDVVAEALRGFGPGLPSPTALVLTAHSGGGAGLGAALTTALRGDLRVDEAHYFDALYGDPSLVLRWAVQRARESGSAPPGALVVIARNGTTETQARRLAAGLARAGLNPARWRVLLTDASHNDIPGIYGPALLANAAATLPGTMAA